MERDKRPQSTGAKYFPEAFEPESLEAGQRIVEDPAFYHAFNQYILSIVADPAQLVRFRNVVINEALRVLEPNSSDLSVREYSQGLTQFPEARGDNTSTALACKTANLTRDCWCALSLATDMYFAETARLSGSASADIEHLKSDWYEMISMAFLPSTSTRKLEITAIRAWIEKFLMLHKSNKAAP